MDIIRATVDYLYDKRIRAFRKATGPLPPDADRVRDAVLAYWQHVNHPLFLAFFELSVAARHDAELADILVPAQKRFDDAFVQLARSVYRLNDRRAAIKRELNARLGSRLVEEKSYAEYDPPAD
jgi:AcrR family transcriptional regulator